MGFLMVSQLDLPPDALPIGWQIAIYIATTLGGLLGVAGIFQAWIMPRIRTRTEHDQKEAEFRVVAASANRAEIDSIAEVLKLYRGEIDNLTERVRSLNEQLDRAEISARGALATMRAMETHIDDWERAAAMEADRGAAIRARLVTKRPNTNMRTR